MRFINIPHSVAVEIPKLGPFIQSFETFVVNTLLPQPLWRQDESWCRTAEELYEKLNDEPRWPGYVLTLSDTEHERLCECVRTVPLNPQIAVHLLPLCRAILGASSKAPETSSPRRPASAGFDNIEPPLPPGAVAQS